MSLQRRDQCRTRIYKHDSPVIRIAALRQSAIHPSIRIVRHVLRLASFTLADVLLASPVGVEQFLVLRPSISTQALLVVPAIVLGAALALLGKEVVQRGISHVGRFIPILDAALVRSLPVWIPQPTSAAVVEKAHAAVVVPVEVLFATLVKGREHVEAFVPAHISWFVSVVGASLLTVVRPIGIEEVDGSGCGRGLRGRARG